LLHLVCLCSARILILLALAVELGKQWTYGHLNGFA
jgi:hypothetical protein